MTTLRFGTDSALHFEQTPGQRVEQCDVPRGSVLEDVPAAVADALSRPLDYPSLASSTVPGDRVVVALDNELPQAPQLTEAVIQGVMRAGVAPDGICLLQSHAGGNPDVDPCRLLPPAVRERMEIRVHDPADAAQMAFLATDGQGHPILLNRALHEADVVLPVGCLRSRAAAGYFGIHSSVFPAFSDDRTQQRFRALGALDPSSKAKRKLVEEVDEVARLLGVHFTVQVVPGLGEEVLHVVAGQSDAVARQGQTLFEAAWHCQMPEQADLVVASVEGAAHRQSWESFGYALDSAVALVEEGGAIAVCCDLTTPPGPALQRLLRAKSPAKAWHEIGRKRPPDALPAAQLMRALDRAKVYLISRLDPETVEDLQMIPLAANQELSRLIRLHSRCILVSGAAYAEIMVD